MIFPIRARAKDLGFTAIGLSQPGRPRHFDPFHSWIRDRKNADMSWLKRNMALREDPSRLLKGCQAIISLAYPYASEKPETPDGFTVSRFSQPTLEDYHDRLRRLCREVAQMIRDLYPACRSRICVDSAPILERSFASSAGIGFIGKNNMLIIPGFGSYFYLAEILTTAPLVLPPVEPLESLCGACTACIDSCPTGALEKPFYLNASRCLSYLTIELAGPLALEDGKRMGDCFFGCDRCQEVCPFNGVDVSRNASLPSTNEFLTMKEVDFRERFGKTAFARAGLEKLKTNIRAVRT
jgi:epoxyqueuosine reductase